MESEIAQITQILGAASSATIEQYTGWFVVSAIIWALVGLSLSVYGGVLLWWAKKHPDDDTTAVALICGAVFVFLGLVLVSINVPDLFYPKAAAIHQLLIDLRG
jgi:hypothetical protein